MSISKLICGAGCAVVLMAALGGCANDSVLAGGDDMLTEFVNGDFLPITYAVSADEAVTRSETLEGDFRVLAWMYDASATTPLYNNGDEELWVGSEILAGRYRGETVSNSGGVWSTTATHYWPRGWFNVDFYATHPATLPDIYTTTDDSDPENPYTYKGVTLTVPANGTPADMLYAFTTTNRDATDNGAVALQFSHALSQVSFMGKTTNAGWHVSVSGMSLHNVCSTGTFDIKRGEWNAASLTGTTDYTLALPNGEAVTFDASDEATALTSDAMPQMLIGQRLDAWDTSESIEENDAAGGTRGCYVRLTCLITSTANGSEENILPANGIPTEIFVPFSNGTSGWEPGKHYVYTLNFGGGYDASGQLNLAPVTLTSSVVPWNEGVTVTGNSFVTPMSWCVRSN